MKNLVNAVRGRKIAERIEANKKLLSWWGYRWLEAVKKGNVFAADLLLGWYWDLAAYDIEVAEAELRGEPVSDFEKALNWRHKKYA